VLTTEQLWWPEMYVVITACVTRDATSCFVIEKVMDKPTIKNKNQSV
jgi:hypothetical protein